MPSDSGSAVPRDIDYHIGLAHHFAAGLSFETFRDDLRTLYAVTRCLEIISEASRRLPAELKQRHAAIAWRNMAAAGNIHRHEYEDVDARQVWDAVQVALPPLKNVVAHELALINDTQ